MSDCRPFDPYCKVFNFLSLFFPETVVIVLFVLCAIVCTFIEAEERRNRLNRMIDKRINANQQIIPIHTISKNS